jgi:hypothetical protein
MGENMLEIIELKLTLDSIIISLVFIFCTFFLYLALKKNRIEIRLMKTDLELHSKRIGANIEDNTNKIVSTLELHSKIEVNPSDCTKIKK